MKKPNASDKVPEIDDETKKRLAERKLKQELEQQRRKVVHEAICLLAESITESELKSKLNILDVSSWGEILEERFISRICGWALCNHPIDLPVRRQKYKLDKKNQKVYETYADCEKFCSKTCEKNFFHVKGQLHELPLWLTGEREEKSFELYYQEDNTIEVKKENTDPEVPELKNPEDSVEFVPDKLLVQLHSLHIAENADSSSDNEEGNDEDEDTLAQKRKDDDRQFLASVKSFVSSTVKSPNPVKVKKVEESKIEETMEEKLQRLRSKWGKEATGKKKSIMLVEPHHLNPEAKEKPKFKPKSFEHVLLRMKDWMTPETIIYVEREGQVKNEQVMEKFLSAILDPQLLEKKEKEQELKAVKLPLIDNVDDHFRRVNIVLNSMMNYWRRLLSSVQIDFPIQNAKDLISTFNLNRENCIVNIDEGELLTILTFHLTIMCNSDLKAVIELKEKTLLYENYLKSNSLSTKVLTDRLTELITLKKVQVK